MTKACWRPAKEKYGVAICSFQSDVPFALPLVIGETVHIFENYTEDGRTVIWYRGCVINNKNKKGIFPASYVCTKPCTVEMEGPFECVTATEDAIVKELTFVLREWNMCWKSLFVSQPSQKRGHNLFQTIGVAMEKLVRFRSTLVSDTLTKEKALDLKHQVVTIIDWGNGKLGMDLVPRVEYRQAEPDMVSIVDMYRIHQRSAENCKGAWPDGMVSVTNGEYQEEVMHHLLVGLYSFACSVGDNCEVYLSLFDGFQSKSLSEKFVIHFDKDGNRVASDKNAFALFTDLSAEDIKKDIYLVMQIFRKGRLSDGTKVKTFQYRRPWGVSVLSLKDLFQIYPENELEYFVRVQCVDSETQFSSLHESLIKKSTQMTSRLMGSDKQNQGVTLSVKILQGELKKVKAENPVLFSRVVVCTQRMGFSDFIIPGEFRNDLYITLHGAEFERGNKKASKNVEVRVTVYNDQYEVIPGCILSANGDALTSDFFTYVVYHSNSPRWNETVRLSIDVERFNTAHIRLELCHCSSKGDKKLYGFAFLTMTTRGNVTRQDSKYDLCLYKCSDGNRIGKYLRLPALHDDFNDPIIIPTLPVQLPFPRSSKEFVTIEMALCSTKFAQKSELLDVLQWSSTPIENVPHSLDKLLTLKGQELIRYLPDILDALFSMLSSDQKAMAAFATNVFEALIHVFHLLQEDMFQKCSSVLDDYLENSFSSPVAHRDMLKCLLKEVEAIYTCTDFDDKQHKKKVFKVLEDIFKFSVKSCILSQRMYGNQLVNDFRASVNDVFKAFGKVMQSAEKELHRAQAQLLNSLHKTFIPLLHIMSTVDLAHMVEFIIGKIRKDASGSVLRAKTQFIKNIINSQLLLDYTSRSKLLPLCLFHLKRCLFDKRHLGLTANTLADLLSTTFKLKETTDVKEEVMIIIQARFDVTVRTLWAVTAEQRAEAGGLLISCLMEMLRLMDVNHYRRLMNDFQKADHLKDFLNRALLVFRDLVNTEDYPCDWTTMTMITNNVMLTAVQYIAEDLTDNFIKDSFDRQLWYNFFMLAVDFIIQPALQLERYSDAKSSQIKERYYDMRVPVGFQIHSLWNQLGLNKQHLMMDLIAPFLKVTMVPELELRKATIPIFFDILLCEIKIHNSLKRVEEKMLQELDFLVIDHHGDKEYKQLFTSILLDKAQSEPELQEEGKRFVFSVTDLLERLLDYREIMDRDEQRDTKMHCTFNILNFYKDNRKDMYIRYISRLYELHYSASNFVEAGMTLRLYGQLLTWTPRPLPAEMAYPAHTEADRKELLFTRILDCFDRGKAWEYGIPLCKELAEHYEKTFQYKKLGQILQKQAAFLYSILEGSKLRQDPTYYRVAYYGNSFPPYLKNKAFIYRGDECLKLSTIMSQLVTEYPNATILTTNSPPDEACKRGEAQFIQIVSVKPVPPERPEFAGKDVPSQITSFYKTNEVDRFQFVRPFHRDDRDQNNEFKSLCLERTILKSSYKLPGILRWYEVVSTSVEMLSPVQAAMDTVQQMNAELKISVDNAAAEPDQHLRHLEMRLQGVVSGAVNGGIPKYQEAFFNDDYAAKYPSEIPHIEDLKAAIFDQIQLLDHCLSVHGKHASQEMQPLHRSLMELFSKFKGSMGCQISPGKSRDSSLSLASSHRPSTPSSNSVNSSGSNRSSVISGNDGNTIDEENLYIENPENPLPSSSSQFYTSSIDASQDGPPIPPRKKSFQDGSSIGNSSSPGMSFYHTATQPPQLTSRATKSKNSLPDDTPELLPSIPQKFSPFKEENRSTILGSSAQSHFYRTISSPASSPGGASPTIPPLPSKRSTVSTHGGNVKNTISPSALLDFSGGQVLTPSTHINSAHSLSKSPTRAESLPGRRPPPIPGAGTPDRPPPPSPKPREGNPPLIVPRSVLSSQNGPNCTPSPVDSRQTPPPIPARKPSMNSYT